jgi:predicted aspartyl protease
VKKKGKNIVSVNVSDLGSKLFFTQCHIGNDNENTFSALADTGATNSLMHTSVAHRLNIEYKPLKIGISTATGVDNDAVNGISHIRFKLKATDG